jgi:hypothetical protein
MQPSERDQLSDRELNDLLQLWKEPTAPARLRAAVFPEESGPWWQNLWRASVRVPLPVAACLVIVLLAAWRWFTPVAPRLVTRTERVEVPVVKEVTRTVYRDRIVHIPASAQGADVHKLQPVTELRPRIIRSGNVQN